MIEIEESIVVSLPRDRVFRFAARPENMPLWNPVVRQSRAVGTLKQGAKVVQLVELLGRRFETTYEVTCYERGRRIAYTSTRGPVEVQGTMEFHAERGGTRVRWIVGGDGRGFFRVAEGVLAGVGRSEMRACLEKLKRLAEEGRSSQDVADSTPERTAGGSSVISQTRTKLFGLVGSLLAQRS